jgi:4-amino-4-deoxy-L-arabinose transferase-like glycosyltransferase
VIEWLALVIIIVGCFLLGWFLVKCFVPDSSAFPGGRLAYLFAAFTTGVLLVGWLAFLSAEVGWFSLPLLAVLWFLATIALYLSSRRLRTSGRMTDGAPTSSRPPAGKMLALPFEPAVLLIWLLAAVWLFFRPHEFIIGGADAGVYVNLSASIAENGRILIQDPILADLDPALYPALLRELPPTENASIIAPYYALPGFYVTDTQAGKITPQFFHLHPVWQAVAYSLGGVRAALLMTALWALGGALALYLIIRQLVGWEAAVLALVTLSLNALQVWFARYPTTEMLTQFLLWTGLWALVLWLQAIKEEKPGNDRLIALLGLISGLALGQLFLVRIDMYFLLIVPGVIWLWLQQNGRWRTIYNWFFLPLAFLILHSILHAALQSRPYAYNLFAYGRLFVERYWFIAAAAVLLGIAALFFFGRFTRQLEKLTQYRRPILIAAITGIVLLALYGWFLRPSLGQTTTLPDWFGGGQWPRTDHENLLRLGWYLSPVGIGLAVAGVCLMIWRINRQTAVILTVGLIFSLLYLWRIQANPHQIYASRRYVPVTLPFAIFAGSYLIGGTARLNIGRLKRPYSMMLAAALALVWLAATGLSARGFMSQVDYQGLIPQVAALNEQLDPNSILVFNDAAAITNGDFIGTPLQYIYGHSVYSLRDSAALDIEAFETAVAGWQQAGHTVYWIGDLEPAAMTAEQRFTVTIETQHLEGVYDRKPVYIVRPRWVLEISKLGEAGG